MRALLWLKRGKREPGSVLAVKDAESQREREKFPQKCVNERESRKKNPGQSDPSMRSQVHMYGYALNGLGRGMTISAVEAL